MSHIVNRGFNCDYRLHARLDGSDARRSAVLEFFANAVIQRCLVHRKRNIKGKLSKRN
ncbi:transposase-like protein [Rhodopirellula rubra]|uniref:Transposase-like protein n=1 Tax=Aporhodopirellula rubra TaxID=980271 RepID=A0A7W5H5R7_9BACT|nr:transposase-like protein [Aporhodopirellula rubra]